MRKSVQFAAVLAVLAVLVGSVASAGEIFFPGARVIPNAPAWVVLTNEKFPPITVAGNAQFTITPVPGGVVYSTPEDEVLMGIQRYVVNGKPSASPVDFPLWFAGATAPTASVPTTGGIFAWGITQADFVKAQKALTSDAKLLKDLEEKLSKAEKAEDKETLKKILAELKKLNEKAEKEEKKAEKPKAPAAKAKKAE